MIETDFTKKTFFAFLLILAIFFSRTTECYSQVETFIILNPQERNVDSREGSTSFEILFEGLTDLNWNIVNNNSWLDVEPLEGQGNAMVFINYGANEGIGRTGEIIITAQGATNSPVTMIINQYNGLPTETIDFTFQQLDYLSAGDLEFLYSGGYAHINYTPFPQGVFLNIGGRSDHSQDTAWIIKNLYLPDESWIADPQEFSKRFDLSLLGVTEDVPLSSIYYFWDISENPYSSFVDKHPGIEHLGGVPRGGTFLVTGRAGTILSDDTFIYTDTIIYNPPFIIDDVVYIGCKMPNGDLDKATRDGELNGCGPAAASNSLNWLEGEHTEIDIIPEWRAAFNELSTLMKRGKNQTVSDEDFIRAKLDFIEMYELPIKVKFQDDAMKADIKSTSGNSSAECKNTAAGYPKKSWLISEAEDKEDVEVGVSYPGNNGGHWVTLTGTLTLNGKTSIWYKHDTIQEKAGGLAQENSDIIEKDGKMIIPGLSNATCDILVSESYDPNYKAPPSSFEFTKYCQSFKKTIAPGKKVTIVFPDNPVRCYNTTLRVLNTSVSNSYKKEATWNFNQGKTRTYVNNTGHPVTIELHNDDRYDEGITGAEINTIVPYTVNFIVTNIISGNVTDISNEEVYGGFSLGTDDDSSDEFGIINAKNQIFTDSIGSYLEDIPGSMGPNSVPSFTINHEVPVWNEFWADLELVIGIQSVTSAGVLNITSIATGFDTTLLINAAGDLAFPIGGMNIAGMMDITFETPGNLNFTFDNIGIPSLGTMNRSMTIIPDSNIFGSGQDTTQINLSFQFAEDQPWQIENNNKWLLISPMSGTGNTSISVIHLANFGPGRTADIIFIAEGITSSPDTISLYQRNGLSADAIDITFQQLDYFSSVDSTFLYSGGFAHLNYVPFPQAVFLNIGARSDLSQDTVWIIKNLYLPDASWIADPQEFSKRFDLAALGVTEGLALSTIYYFWDLSYNPFPSFVDRHPGIEHLAGVPFGGTFLVTGREDTLFSENTFSFVDSIIFNPPFILEDVVYIGCKMPNGDLDKATRDGELNGCGPAAASNSLNWLEGEHDEIDIKPEWRAAFNELSTLMKRAKNKGVGDRNFIRAKLDFIEMYELPIKVKFQDNSMKADIKSTSGNSSAECKDKKAGYPKKSWLISEAEDKEDVEVGVTYPGSNSGHWVALTGTMTLNGKTSIWYKHDTIQEKAGGLAQENSDIIEKDGKMIIPGISNATCDILVSESYDPNYKPPPSSFDYNKYCQSFKKTIAPGKKVKITFPDEPNRCFNTTLRVLDRGVSNSYKKEATWNHNKGKSRTYVNKTGRPVTIELHNDDKYNGGFPGFKTYIPFNVSFEVEDIQTGDQTDASNENVYGGFSIGADDDSSEEFGDLAGPEILYVDSIGAYLDMVPKTMGPNKVTKFTINHNVPVWNNYWSNLELIIGVESVDNAGTLEISSTITGLDTVIIVNSVGDYVIPLGGILSEGMFDLTFKINGNLGFTFDNIGIPSIVDFGSSINEIEKPSAWVKIFPNPNNGEFSIKLVSETSKKARIEVFDIQGKSVFSKESLIINGELIEEINIGPHSRGIFYVRVIIGSEIFNNKVVIE